MLTKYFEEAAEIIQVLEKNGYKAYFVGGCVRDLLLNRKVKDIDITTSASPEKIQTLFNKVIPVGIKHGTVIVRHKGHSYEVTTFRIDGTYSDKRHPDEVKFVHDIDEDLKRRDFTINALAMNKEGELIDLYGGKKDLERKLIRSVGNAKERFLEDPLRIIRALRFSSQLSFSIEEETLYYMQKLNKEIQTVAVERLTNEFTKLFQGDNVQNGLTYLLSIQGEKYLPIFQENPFLLKLLPKPLSPFYSFGEVIAMFHFLDRSIPIAKWIKEWKCSNKIKCEAVNLLENLLYYNRNGLDPWLIYQLHRSNFKQFVHLLKLLFNRSDITFELLNNRKDALSIQKRRDLNINGDDLQEIFPEIKRGPWIKEILEKVEYKVVTNQLKNNKQVIKEWVLCHPPEIN